MATTTIPVEIKAEYTVLAHDGKADVSGFGQINGGKVIVEPYSATILAEY